MGMTPEEFFAAFVEKNFEDFYEKEDNIRLGFNAAISAFHMADHYLNYCDRNYPSRIQRFADKDKDEQRKNYLKYLSKKSKYFNDIQSIANVYKHLYQRNPDADHVTVGSAGSIQMVKTDEPNNLEITQENYVVYRRINTNETIRLKEALEDVINMWKNELSS